MKQHGFTLIEVLVVISIIGILSAIGTLQFQHYVNKANVEKQTKELYSDLMTARTEALIKQGNKRMVIYPTYYSYTSMGGAWSKGYSKAVRYNLQWAGGGTSKIIDFDERGLFDIVSNGNTSICVNHAAASDAVYNSVVVFSTRIQMGKLNEGATSCAKDNIVVK